MEMRRNDEAFRDLEVRCNLCATTQSVCGITSASLLFQIAALCERRVDPAELSLCPLSFDCGMLVYCFRTQLNVYCIVNVARSLLLG